MSQDNAFSESNSSESLGVRSRPLSFLRLAAYCTIGILFLVSLGFNFSLWFSKPDSLKSSQIIIWPLLMGLTVISIASLIMSVWLYYVRVVYLRQGPALVPEKWGELLSLSSYSVDRLKDENKELSKILRYSLDTTKQSYQELIQNFSTLKGTLDDREGEIERLKKGYDSKVFRNFLRRFLRVDKAIKCSLDESTDEEVRKSYRYFSKLMDDALDECGVDVIEPALGSDFRDLGSEVADEPKTQPTKDPNMDFKISKIISTGYKIVGQESEETIIPATVEIFKLEN